MFMAILSLMLDIVLRINKNTIEKANSVTESLMKGVEC